MIAIFSFFQLMFEAQFIARIEKIKIIGSTFMAACGLMQGRKGSQDYEGQTEPFSKERLNGNLSGLHIYLVWD